MLSIINHIAHRNSSFARCTRSWSRSANLMGSFLGIFLGHTRRTTRRYPKINSWYYSARYLYAIWHMRQIQRNGLRFLDLNIIFKINSQTDKREVCSVCYLGFWILDIWLLSSSSWLCITPWRRGRYQCHSFLAPNPEGDMTLVNPIENARGVDLKTKGRAAERSRND